MSWQSVAIITPSREWQYTPAILGNFFRIKHLSNSEFANNFRAIIAQAFEEPDKTTFFDIKRLAFKPESEAFLFVQPGGLLNRKLAIKQLDYLPDDWTIEIEVLGGMSSSISLPIEQSEVLGLEAALTSKVDVESLSTHILSADHPEATASSNGMMSAIDKRKLDEIKRSYDQELVPVNPSVGEIWKERDRNNLLIQEWFWNGTYWLSSAEVVFTQNLNLGSLGNTVSPVLDFTLGQAIDRRHNLFITRYIFSAFMGSSSSANYTTRIGVSIPRWDL